MDNVVEKIQQIRLSEAGKPQFDPVSFSKPDERREIDRCRREYLMNGPRTLERTIKGKRVTIQSTGKIQRFDGTGEKIQRTMCQYFRPGIGAQTDWQPGCVPRPDLIHKEDA